MSTAYAFQSSALHRLAKKQNKDCNRRQGPGQATTLSQELRQRSLSITSASSLTPRSHQRRWSADFCRNGTSPVIIVKKSVKEPQPPQRGASILRPHTTSQPPFKRYSCPLIGNSRSPSQSPSASTNTSTTSSTSSCSSPSPVKTSDVIGSDPLGWKLHPKSTFTSPQARTRRLSLQISLPLLPDLKSSPTPNLSPVSQPDPTPKTKPPLKPKPFRRHHSESSAFLRSLANSVPVVTLEELGNVNLRHIANLDESDDVFSEENDEENVTTRRKPPPVPEKTAMARQIAQLIAHSRQRRWPVTARTNREEHIYAEIPQKPEDHRSLHATNTGLHRDTRERTTQRFLTENSKKKEPETPSNSKTINYRGD